MTLPSALPSAWEVTTKYRLGRLPEAESAALDFVGSSADQGFQELVISVADAERAGRFPGPIATRSTECSLPRPWHTTGDRIDRYGIRPLRCRSVVVTVTARLA